MITLPPASNEAHRSASCHGFVAQFRDRSDGVWRDVRSDLSETAAGARRWILLAATSEAYRDGTETRVVFRRITVAVFDAPSS